MDYQRLQKLASAPDSPSESQFYYDTTLKAMGFWDGTEWVYVANGSVTGGVGPLPSGGALGDDLISNGSSVGVWVNPGNDSLQGGYLGVVNTGAITAVINSSTGVLTFTNWPTADVVWILTSAGILLRSVVPAAPTPTVTGVTSGDYAYIQVHLVPPTTPGGTCTTAITVGTSRTTAALAAADQVGAASTDSSLLVWDGIAHLASGVWSLVAGTPASGSIIPAATGRDRRPWVNGAYGDTSAVTATDLSATSAAVISSSLGVRLECTGVPLELDMVLGTMIGTANDVTNVYIGCDGDLITGESIAVTTTGGQQPLPISYFYTPPPGSHLFMPYYYVSAGAINFYNVIMTVREKISGSSNGTA